MFESMIFLVFFPRWGYGLASQEGIYHTLQPWKLTCPQKRDYFNRKYIFQPSFFRGYVSFLGGYMKNYPVKTGRFWCSKSLPMLVREKGITPATPKSLPTIITAFASNNQPTTKKELLYEIHPRVEPIQLAKKITPFLYENNQRKRQNRPFANHSNWWVFHPLIWKQPTNPKQKKSKKSWPQKRCCRWLSNSSMACSHLMPFRRKGNRP